MIIKLNHNNAETLIRGRCDAEFASSVMAQTKWAMNEIDYDLDAGDVLCQLRTQMPSLTAPDAMSIKSAMNSPDDIVTKFVAICNILAGAHIFSKVTFVTDFKL